MPEFRSDGSVSQAFPKPKSYSAGVGKYIRPEVKSALKRIGAQAGSAPEPDKKQPKKAYDFSDW